MNKYLVSVIIAATLLLGLFFYDNSRLENGNLTLVVCDVGQGDGILIRTSSGDDILIDGGPNDKILDCLSRHMPFWDRTIELVILTHPDADHLTGLISVIQRYSVINYVTVDISRDTAVYKKFQNALEQKNITPKYLFAGDRIDFSDKSFLEILWPRKEDFAAGISSNPNDYSVVKVLSFGKFRALLTGDAETKVIDSIADKTGSVDILKVSHHGAKNGTTDYFLSQVRPTLALISSGANNRYGHPARQTLDLLEKHKINYLRTDEVGDIKIVTDGKNYKIISSQN